ncbi:DUF5818 domain-containing protein [Sphingomonas sp. 1P06PA]|uniref:DUF5818 domain-containing protein n=1 Tax=Sphingomonas sp. 1P06PA TaxID=554121 RepID=UPI0039A40E25
MAAAGEAFDAQGTLVRDGGGFALRMGGGALVRLVLSRTPVDLVEKQVRVIGSVDGDGAIDVDGIAPAGSTSTS